MNPREEELDWKRMYLGMLQQQGETLNYFMAEETRQRDLVRVKDEEIKALKKKCVLLREAVRAYQEELRLLEGGGQRQRELIAMKYEIQSLKDQCGQHLETISQKDGEARIMQACIRELEEIQSLNEQSRQHQETISNRDGEARMRQACFRKLESALASSHDDRSDQHRPESRIIPSPGMAYTDLIRTIHPHFCFTKDAYEFTKKFFSQHGIDKPEKVPTAKSRGIRAMGVPQYLHEDYLSQFRDWELARGMEGSEFDTDEDPDSHSDSDSESNYDLDPGF